MRYVVGAADPFVIRTAHALVAPGLTEHANASSNRVFSATDPLRTQCAETKGGHFALVSAFLAKHYGGVVGSRLPTPIGTVTATDHHSLVVAHLTKFNTGSVGYPASSPLHTIVAGSCGPETNPAGGSSQGIVTAQLVGVGGRAAQSRARPVCEPGGTTTAKGDVALVRVFLIKYYGSDQAPELQGPLHTVTSRDRFGLVTVSGQDYAIADIGLRMLTPRELFRAQGFPERYAIGDGVGLNLTKSAQVRMCGNSVCPPVACALVSANVPELAREEAVA